MKRKDPDANGIRVGRFYDSNADQKPAAFILV